MAATHSEPGAGNPKGAGRKSGGAAGRALREDIGSGEPPGRRIELPPAWTGMPGLTGWSRVP